MPPPTLSGLEQKYFAVGGFLGTPHSADTVVTPHVDGESYFAAIADVLDTCKGSGDRIYIASWWLEPAISLRTTPGAKGLDTILIDLADAGADVRVIAAAPRFSVGTEGLSPANVAFWVAKVASVAGLAKFPQINVRAVRKLRATLRAAKMPLEGRVLLDWGGRADARHEKSTVIYSATTGQLHAFVGGIDFGKVQLADELHATGPWHDVGVQLHGGAASAVLGNFRTRWTETVTLPRQRYMLDGIAEEFNPTIESAPPGPAPAALPALPASVPAGSYLGSSVRVLRSYEGIRAFSPWLDEKNIPWDTLPAQGIGEILTAIKNAIDKAQNYVYVEDQTINPSALTRLYETHKLLYPSISAACARGVKVIFVTQGIAGPGAPVTANLSMSPEIADLILDPLSTAERGNFALHYVKGTKVHSKLVIVDDEFVSIGSANFWDRSMVGTESELNAMIVHPGGYGSLAADLRVRIWRGHLRVSQSPSVDAELRDLAKSLGLFRSAWGTGITFPHPNSALVAVSA